MALIVIKIRDAEDGTVDVSLESEPPFSLRDDGPPMTDAQVVAFGMLNSATDDAETIHSVKAE